MSLSETNMDYYVVLLGLQCLNRANKLQTIKKWSDKYAQKSNLNNRFSVRIRKRNQQPNNKRNPKRQPNPMVRKNKRHRNPRPIKPQPTSKHAIRGLFMVKCPVCGKPVADFTLRIDAPNFKIDEYRCLSCGKRFRIIN